MKRNKRILFVVNVDWFFISHRLPIAAELVKRGCEVHVAAIDTGRANEIADLGIRFHPLKMRRGKVSPFELWSNFSEIYSVIRDVKPEIVHLITIKPNLFGGIAARILKVPQTVMAISGLGSVFVEGGAKTFVRRVFVEKLYRFAAKQKHLTVIFQNANDKQIMQRFAKLHDSQIKTLPGSGVALDDYKVAKTPSSKEQVIMFAGRLLREKGVAEFVQVARAFHANASDHNAPVKFVLVGAPDDDNPSSISQKEIDGWVSEGIVEYWGFQANMPAILRKATIFVYPSYYREGLAKVLLEAAAAGLPIITTDHPGCREAVIDNKTGIIVPKTDVNALIGAVAKLIDDPDLATQMGFQARKFAEENFGVDSIIEQHMAIYDL